MPNDEHDRRSQAEAEFDTLLDVLSVMEMRDHLALNREGQRTAIEILTAYREQVKLSENVHRDQVARYRMAHAALEENSRRQITKLVEAARDLYEQVEMDESVGICLSDRVPSLRLGQVLHDPGCHG